MEKQAKRADLWKREGKERVRGMERATWKLTLACVK